MGDNASDRPCHCRVLGGKRGPTLAERSGAVPLIRALATCSVFKKFDYGQTVDPGFAAKKSGLALVGIVGGEAKKVESAGTSDHGVSAVIRDVLVTKQGVGRI